MSRRWPQGLVIRFGVHDAQVNARVYFKCPAGHDTAEVDLGSLHGAWLDLDCRYCPSVRP